MQSSGSTVLYLLELGYRYFVERGQRLWHDRWRVPITAGLVAGPLQFVSIFCTRCPQVEFAAPYLRDQIISSLTKLTTDVGIDKMYEILAMEFCIFLLTDEMEDLQRVSFHLQEHAQDCLPFYLHQSKS